MTAEYTDPSSSDKDAVRFLIGDVDMSAPLVTDEEIDYVVNKYLTLYGTQEYCASVVADNIAARYARETTISADGQSVDLAPVAQQFRELAASLRQQHKNLLVGGGPDVGGITPGEETDPDIAPFNFGIGLDDNPEAGQQNYGGVSQPYYIAELDPGV